MPSHPIARHTRPAHDLAFAFVLAMLVFISTGTGWAGEEPTRVRIGIVADGPSPRQDQVVDLFRTEMERVATGTHAVVIPADAVVNGSWEREGIARAFDSLDERGDLDVILAVGVGAAAEVCGRSETAVPVVFPFFLGSCAASCSHGSEQRFRSIDLAALITRDLRAFSEIVTFDRVAIVTDSRWPGECSDRLLEEDLAPDGVELAFVSMGAADLAIELPPGTDAVYLMPLMQLDDGGLKDLVTGLTTRGLPTFSMVGESEVDLGVLAGMSTRADLTAVARGAALDVLDLVEGRPRQFDAAAGIWGQLSLNMETARALDLRPGWELITRARLLHDRKSRNDRPIDLESAMRQAMDANLDLAVQERRVAAGAEDIRLAKASYRPQLELALVGVASDENHAVAALGQYAAYAAGSLTLTQLIYSDGASGNIDAQRDLQRAREQDWQALRLDMARAAVTAYMDVMRSNAVIGIRQEQVDLTRTNLELARLRRSLGASPAADVHRWEAELATARAGLLDALSRHRQSERKLSRLLGEPLTTRWATQAPDLPAALATLGGAEDASLLATVDGYYRLTSSLVVEGLERAPELAALDRAIAAQERILKAARRASYAPTVALQGNHIRFHAKDETGGLDLGEMAELIPQFDDTSWNVGLQASLPIVTGGTNAARRTVAREQLLALRMDHRSARDKLSQRTLSALDAATASWSTIALRRQAAEAASRTQDLVHDAYARGAASILEVLDAQNSALDAELAETTSLYDFLDDWAGVRRAVAGIGVASLDRVLLPRSNGD